MGKLPIIIPRGGITRDSVRVVSSEEERATKTAVIVGSAVARSSATSGTIADSDRAAADRDSRFLIARVIDSVQICSSVLRGECSRENQAFESRPITAIAEIDVRSDLGRRRHRDAGVFARLRRNTWHAEGESESVAVSKDIDLAWRSSASLIANYEYSRTFGAPDASQERWNARIAGDDRTCCVAIDIASFLTRRRTRDRVIRVERRSRRASSILFARSRSIGAPTDLTEIEKVLRSTVDSITIGRENRNRFPVPFIDAADVFKCDGHILSNSTVNNSSAVDDVDDRSPITVFEVRESIGSGDYRINTGHTRSGSGSNEPARLIEIGIVESPCEERPRLLVEEANYGASSSLLLPAKIDSGRTRWAKTDACWRLPRIGLVLRALLLGLLAMSLLCDAVLAAPSDFAVTEIFEDGIEDDELAMPRNDLGDDELEIIRRSIVQGLGLQRIPDPAKANVSQAEYERAHREYLKQVQLQSHDVSRTRRDLHVFQTAEHPGNKSSINGDWNRGNHHHSLYFPVTVSDTEDVTVDHASLRFLLQGDHRRPLDLEVLIYFRTPVTRHLQLRRSIPQGEPTDSRWLELDSTEAAVNWLERNLDNHGIELEFLHDGQPIRREISYATLNVFTTSEPGVRRKRSTPEELMPLHKGRRSKCKGDKNKKCCRHELTVMFKDLKGFEFIVYPKGFDAGFCKGRCPPRYNPAHHHALLQSLLWKEDRKRVPKPCCAPSKLEQLTIVYFDENDATQLQVSYWKNIQVLECACS